MDQLVDSSTYDKDISINGESPHSEVEQDLSPSERTTPTGRHSHLSQTYSSINNFAAPQFMNNAFALANNPFSSVAAATLNPLGFLQSTNTNLAAQYAGLDSLSMATAMQSASIGAYTTGDCTLPSSPWSKYLEHINGRKRKRVKTPTPTDSASSSTSDFSTMKKCKMVQNQPTSTSSNGLGEKKDDGYWDRRRKNNEAAKRSRDAKRMKEVHTARKAEFLERENVELKAQINLLKSESANLQCLLFNSKLNASQAIQCAATPATSMATLMKHAVEVSQTLQ